MSTPYADLMIRDYFGDNGTGRSSGNLSASPDIIPWGTTPLPDFQTYLTTPTIVTQDVGKDIQGFQTNYLFIRCLNQAAGAATGKVYLYYSPSNLLMAPGMWSQNVINTQNGAGFGVVSPTAQGQYVVGDSPFIWDPQPPPNNQHYCLVGRVTTAADPNPIPTNVATMNDFVNYIATTPSVAWRNVVFVGTPPDWSNNVPYTGLASEDQIYFQLNCTGLPIGSQIGFTSADPGPSPSINLQPTIVSTNPNFSAGVWTTVPANWSGTITVNWWSNGQGNWQAGATIGLKSFYTPPGGQMSEALARHFRPAKYFGIEDPAPRYLGSGPTPMYVVGSVIHQ